MATPQTVLCPRFYTTDFAALETIAFEPVCREGDALMAEFRADPNEDHFLRDARFDAFRRDGLPKARRKEPIEFLVSSVTGEFPGGALYVEMKRHPADPDPKELFAATRPVIAPSGACIRCPRARRAGRASARR